MILKRILNEQDEVSNEFIRHRYESAQAVVNTVMNIWVA
jgi:hypothetical protein